MRHTGEIGPEGTKAMWKTLAAVFVAAIVAAAVTGLPIVSEEATASAAISGNKVAVPVCSERGWPYVQCGERQEAKIRLVTTDRIAN